MRCHKCKFESDDEEETRTHMLFNHGFFMPYCSTDVAHQANIDYEKIRNIYKKTVLERMKVKKSRKSIPQKYHPMIKIIERLIKTRPDQCNLKKMTYTNSYGTSSFFDSFYYTKKGIAINTDSYSGKKLYSIPKYLRERVEGNIKRNIKLEKKLNHLNKLIRKEGIVV